MPDPFTGVFPCYENQFKVDNAGAITYSGGSISAATAKTIADMESYSVAFDNGVEEWKAFDQEGWTRRMMTAKSIKISVKGKRNVGDAGNDLIDSASMQNGTAAERDILWTFPDGSQVLFSHAVINVTASTSGDAPNVGPLEFEILSNGKPTYIPAA